MLDKVSFLLWGHMQSVRADPFSVALYLLDSQNPCYNINKKTGDGGMSMMIYLQTIETGEDKTKFEQIYAEYRGLMFHVAYEVLHNEENAEDATHQAFVRIAENIRKIDMPVCPKTRSYVVTIVEHEAIDQYRRIKRRRTVPLTDELHGIEVAYDGENALAACILKLPARYREMILLRYHHGYSVREIAEILGLSLPAAIKLDQRAKKKLEDFCRKEGML